LKNVMVAGKLGVDRGAERARWVEEYRASGLEELNRTETCFPGSSLRLRYAVQGVPAP
jgi:hypothetical protein